MSNEIVINTNLARLLTHHGVQTHQDDEFVYTDLANSLKFKARVVYHEVNGGINSRLDVMILTDKGESIIESFGDYGATVDDAVNKNFQSFSSGSLHPILAAFGSTDPETLRHVEIEEWSVNNRRWQVYMGNLVPKSNGPRDKSIPPAQFFQSIENGIRSQKLTNRIHWFRSYYCQWEGTITEKEFLMDNEPKGADLIFGALPVIPDVDFFSCRNFIVVKAP